MLSLFLSIVLGLAQNPFEIDFQKDGELAIEDYVRLQETLDALDIKPYLRNFYSRNKILEPDMADEIEFLSKTLRGAKAKFFDTEKKLFPSILLQQINEGSDICIVSTIPYRANYNEMLDEQIQGLKASGFNGFHLSFRGSYPNPTGTEIKYSAVPYAKKIFALLEAKKRGFHKVVWLDSSFVPAKDISPLFKDLETAGALYLHYMPNGFSNMLRKERLPPETKQLLIDLTGQDPTSCLYICGGIMAFNMLDPLFDKFVDDFYAMVKLGTPFLSCNPEEYVISAILAQPCFKKWNKMNASYSPLFLKDEGLMEYTIKNSSYKKDTFFKITPHQLASDVFDNRQEFEMLAEGSKMYWINACKEYYDQNINK